MATRFDSGNSAAVSAKIAATKARILLDRRPTHDREPKMKPPTSEPMLQSAIITPAAPLPWLLVLPCAPRAAATVDTSIAAKATTIAKVVSTSTRTAGERNAA